MQHPCGVKIIFLDIDGVLNCASEYGTAVFKLPDHVGHYFHVPELIERFNKIIAATDAKIVVSSTWRRGETLETMSGILKALGVHGECVGLTPVFDTNYSVRGNEILAWIKQNVSTPYYNYQNYVIIDDDSDMLYWQKDNFVNTNGVVGLTDKDCMKAISILNTIYQPIDWNLL